MIKLGLFDNDVGSIKVCLEDSTMEISHERKHHDLIKIAIRIMDRETSRFPKGVLIGT